MQEYLVLNLKNTQALKVEGQLIKISQSSKKQYLSAFMFATKCSQLLKGLVPQTIHLTKVKSSSALLCRRLEKN